MSGAGLVGKVSDVAPDAARVVLLTDHTSGVSAQVVPDGANGLVKATVGNPSDLILDFVQKGRPVPKGATVITSGWRSSRLESLFPRGIPIGTVTRSDSNERELYQRVHLHPFADLRNLDVVEVLTSGGSASGQKAQLVP
jgi:rod shape-determining protein MreC